MKEQLISFETAKLAKEKGFNEECRYYYTEMQMKKDSASTNLNWYSDDGYCYAPTQSLLQKWLREEHNIKVYNVVAYDDDDKQAWESVIYLKKGKVKNIKIRYSYEESLEEGLLEALKIIKI